MAALKSKGAQEGWLLLKRCRSRLAPRAQRRAGGEEEQPGWTEFQLELRNKMRVSDHQKNGQAAREDYKDVLKLCREKIRRAKTQLKFNLATALKADLKCFSKYISNKKWLRRIFILYWMGGKTVFLKYSTTHFSKVILPPLCPDSSPRALCCMSPLHFHYLLIRYLRI